MDSWFRYAKYFLLACAGSVVMAAAPSDPKLVTWVQCRLTQVGLDPGAIDGRMGEKTRQAIRKLMGSADPGEVSEQLVERLRRGTAVEYLAKPPGGKSMITAPPPPLARCSNRVGFDKGGWRCLTESECESFKGAAICGDLAKDVVMTVVLASSACGGNVPSAKAASPTAQVAAPTPDEFRIGPGILVFEAGRLTRRKSGY